MTWPIAGWSTTLYATAEHMGAGDAAGRCWRMVTRSQEEWFSLVAPQSAMVVGQEYEVELTVLTERSNGSILSARADRIEALSDADPREALRAYIAGPDEEDVCAGSSS